MGMYSSGGGQQTSTTQTTYSPDEQAARNEIADLGSWAMRMNLGYGDDPKTPEVEADRGGNWWQYTGPKPVAASNDTMASWNSGAQAAQTIGTNTGKAQTANNFGLSQALYANSNPYLAGHIQAAQRPLVEQFMMAGGPMSTIRSGSVANGTYGGSRQGIAEGLAAKGLMRELGDISTTMQSGAYSEGLQAQQAAVKNQGLLNMMTMMPSQIQSQIGQQRETYAQEQENYAANVREQQKNGMWDPLQNFANIVYGGSNPTTSVTSSIPKQNNTGQVLGSLGTMAMMYMMMSDKRLKSHIKRVGTHARGFGIYVYKIFGQWQLGVLAQEVQKVLPAAVMKTPSGYLAVNYGMLK